MTAVVVRKKMMSQRRYLLEQDRLESSVWEMTAQW
jgi:hypothetical protein